MTFSSVLDSAKRSVITSVQFAADKLKIGYLNTKEGVRKVVFIMAEALHDFYSPKGLGALSKFCLAIMKLPYLIKQYGQEAWWHPVNDTFIKMKDFYLATNFIDSTAEFIFKDKDTNQYHFAFPRVNETGHPYKGCIDWSKVFLAIANYIEVANFTIKYNVCKLHASVSHLAARFGSIKLFQYKGRQWSMGDVPVINAFAKNGNPKDFFIIFGSLFDIHKCWHSPKWTFLHLLKVVGDIGKITLITLAGYMKRAKLDLCLATVDLFTQGAGLIKVAYELHKLRQSQVRLSRSY